MLDLLRASKPPKASGKGRKGKGGETRAEVVWVEGSRGEGGIS